MVSVASERVADIAAVYRPRELARTVEFGVLTCRHGGISSHAYLLNDRLFGYLRAESLSRILLAVNVGYFDIAHLLAALALYENRLNSDIESTGLDLDCLVVKERYHLYLAYILYRQIAFMLHDIDHSALAAALLDVRVHVFELGKVHVEFLAYRNRRIACFRDIDTLTARR